VNDLMQEDMRRHFRWGALLLRLLPERVLRVEEAGGGRLVAVHHRSEWRGRESLIASLGNSRRERERDRFWNVRCMNETDGHKYASVFVERLRGVAWRQHAPTLI